MCMQVSADLIVLLKAQHTFSSSALIQTGSDASAAAETALYKKVCLHPDLHARR